MDVDVFVFPGAVSIGGFGIREAAFIVILGLFGVGRENALASSFISLASVLITVGASGLIRLNDGLNAAWAPPTRGSLIRAMRDIEKAIAN
jgi:hypothetical protein